MKERIMHKTEELTAKFYSEELIIETLVTPLRCSWRYAVADFRGLGGHAVFFAADNMKMFVGVEKKFGFAVSFARFLFIA